MSMIRRVAFGLALLAFLLATALQASTLEVYFGPRKPGDPQGLDTQAIRVINSAKKRLNCAVHELRLQSITDALIAAKKRGVEVRMVGEDRYYDNDFMKQIRAAGIPTVSDNDPTRIMHNKFVVADGQRLFTGSYNLTDTCSYNNFNNLVYIEDPAAAKIFDDEFELLFAGHIYDEGTAQQPHQVTLTLSDRKVPIEVFFQPRDKDSEQHVLDKLTASKQAIYVMEFAFFNGKVGALLQDKFKAKQDVKAVIDYSMVFGDFEPFNQIGRLVETGIPFSIGDVPDAKIHHKVFVVDPDSDDAVVLTGSANASSAGFNKNAENILVIHDKQIAGRYRDECLRLLHRIDYGQAVDKPRGLNGIGSEQHFDVTISSGGHAMRDVELSLPFHWHVSSPGDVQAWRGDQNNLRSSISLASRIPSHYTQMPVTEVVLKNANLTASGPGSSATIRIKSLHMDPETLPGKYVMYVRGSDENGNLQALASMPLMWLFRTSAENVAYMVKLFGANDPRSATDLQYLVRDLDSGLEQDIEKGQLQALGDFAMAMEQAKQANNPLFKVVVPVISPLVKKLNFAVSSGGANADQMKQLAARLQGLRG